MKSGNGLVLFAFILNLARNATTCLRAFVFITTEIMRSITAYCRRGSPSCVFYTLPATRAFSLATTDIKQLAGSDGLQHARFPSENRELKPFAFLDQKSLDHEAEGINGLGQR